MRICSTNRSTRSFTPTYLYHDFANYYEDEGLDGFAHWYEIQAQEERDHALMLRRYLIDNSVRVTFGEIAKPDKEYKNAYVSFGGGA